MAGRRPVRRCSVVAILVFTAATTKVSAPLSLAQVIAGMRQLFAAFVTVALGVAWPRLQSAHLPALNLFRKSGIAITVVAGAMVVGPQSKLI